MRKVIIGVIALCAGSFVYAASPHDAHVPAPAHAQTAQHVSKAPDGGAELSKTLTVSDCWIRSLPRPTPSAGYFVIKNAGNNEAKLISMSIPAFDQVSLHQTIDQDGKSTMAVADAVSIPAGGELQFKPGSYHAMLEKPTQALAVGTEVEAGFEFQSGETAKALCEVKPANALSR
jgi:periplasmic copper chaperone A